MEDTVSSYECAVHKKQHAGVKRDTFEKELFDALLLTSMEYSYRLYKDVKHGCHCPENYAAFDKILQEFKSKSQTSQVKTS
jgi:hypothetical protein